MVHQFAFAAVLVAFCSQAVFATDPWIGKEVYLKSGAKAKLGEREINIQQVPAPAMVGDVKGDWLWLEQAWVHKDDVFLLEDAVDYWSDQIRQEPSVAQNWNSRGTVWNKRGEFENAIKDLTEAIRLDPTFAAAFAHRGHSWAERGEFDKALKDYTRAMKLDPSDASSYNNAAWLRATCTDATCRDGSMAVMNATAACILSEWKDSSNLDTLAAAYAQLGDFSSAVKWQEKAIELATEDSDKAEMRLRLDLYDKGKPYREMPNK
jgi:tetratricopeptide (TPR) repeat protein